MEFRVGYTLTWSASAPNALEIENVVIRLLNSVFDGEIKVRSRILADGNKIKQVFEFCNYQTSRLCIAHMLKLRRYFNSVDLYYDKYGIHFYSSFIKYSHKNKEYTWINKMLYLHQCYKNGYIDRSYSA